jgi:hypothetical protein
MKLSRMPLKELELCSWEGDPRDYWRSRDAPAGLAVTNHAVGWFAAYAVSNCTAKATSFRS